MQPLALGDLTVTPDDPFVVDDPYVVHGVRLYGAGERLHRPFADAVDRDTRVALVDGQIQRRPVDDGRLRQRRVEDLKKTVALFTAPHPAERVVLLICFAVDVRVAVSALVVDRARPPEQPGNPRAGETTPVERAVFDHVCEDRLAIS